MPMNTSYSTRGQTTMPKPNPCSKGGLRALRQLQLIATLMCREGLVQGQVGFSHQFVSCQSLQSAWGEYVDMCVNGARSEEGKLTIEGYRKGTRGLFDYDCGCHDSRAAFALSEWLDKMSGSAPGHTRPDILKEIKHRAGILLRSRDTDYWRSYSEADKDVRYRVPDRNACLEKGKQSGGTFSVGKKEAERRTNRLFIAPVFTKGKCRVVTCQPAIVKRVLGPVMEAAYDWLSSQPWLVRGDVTSEHYKWLDEAMGEEYVSGDYSSATDNIHRDAVMAVVEVLAEVLSEAGDIWLASVLETSFRTIWAKEKRCGAFKYKEIKNGSMMGSKCSFVVLCLINRIMFDMWSGVVTKKNPVRRVLINGDDIAFKKRVTEEIKDWKRAVGVVGLCVNEKKTAVRPSHIEINSQPWSPSTGLLKKPTFGFFETWSDDKNGEWHGTRIYGPGRGRTYESRCGLAQLVDLARFIKFENWCWFSSIPFVFESVRRSVVAPGNVPGRLWRVLKKKNWFCQLAKNFSPESEFRGDLEFVAGPVPVSEADHKQVCKWNREYVRRYIYKFVGKEVVRGSPTYLSKTSTKRADKNPVKREYFTGTYLWIKGVLDWYKAEQHARSVTESGRTMLTRVRRIARDGLSFDPRRTPFVQLNTVDLVTSRHKNGFSYWVAPKKEWYFKYSPRILGADAEKTHGRWTGAQSFGPPPSLLIGVKIGGEPSVPRVSLPMHDKENTYQICRSKLYVGYMYQAFVDAGDV